MAFDQHYSNVVLGLHFDGSNGSTTFTDVKGHTITRAGNAVISTAQSKFGGASGLFDGSGDYLTVTPAADLAMGTGDFTIETWARLAATSGIPRGIAESRANSANTTGFYFGTFGTLAQFFSSSSNINGGTVPLNTWTHIAAERLGTTVTLYVNGTSVASGSCPNNFSENNIWIGSGRAGSSLTDEFNGYLDDFRLTKGVARYQGNFTPESIPFCDILSSSHTIAGAATPSLSGAALSHSGYSIAGTALINALSSVIEAVSAIVGSGATSLVGFSTAYTNFALSGATVLYPTHDDRSFSLDGAASVNPTAIGLNAAPFSSAGSTDLSALKVWAHVLASYGIDAAGIASFAPTAFWPRAFDVRGKGGFDPYISHNKDVRFSILAGANIALVSDGKEIRRFSIDGRSEVLFSGPAADCVLRMALPFDRIKPRTLRISGASSLKASTDIPGEVSFTIRGCTRLAFKPIEEKVRCAKLISRQRNKAVFRSSHG